MLLRSDSRVTPRKRKWSVGRQAAKSARPSSSMAQYKANVISTRKLISMHT